MCKKRKTPHVQKSHNANRGRRGFTLVELSVVLALLAIIVTLIISFCILMGDFADGNRAEYAFLEDHAALKEALCSWVAENDGPDCLFSIAGDGTLTANGTGEAVRFTDGVLSLGGRQVVGLDAIDSVVFTVNDKLIKCVTSRTRIDGESAECSFVIYIRSGRIVR